jgi:hypothetical protein
MRFYPEGYKEKNVGKALYRLPYQVTSECFPYMLYPSEVKLVTVNQPILNTIAAPLSPAAQPAHKP